MNKMGMKANQPKIVNTLCAELISDCLRNAETFAGRAASS
jgi:hypothetical protein